MAPARGRFEDEPEGLEVHVIVVEPRPGRANGRDAVDDVPHVRPGHEVSGVGKGVLVAAHRPEPRMHLEEVPERDFLAVVVAPGGNPFRRRLVE